jgi:multidrug resistance protein MdtO
MTMVAEAALPGRSGPGRSGPGRSGLWSFLREELAARPGRVAASARIAGGCVVVVAIAMMYQIPLPAYMAYLVFLVSQRETASTLLTGVVGSLAVTLAIVLSLLLYTLDAAEPALRLPLMAGSTFLGMFLVRTMALGPVAFLAGYILVLSQTLIDEISNLESLTRLVLWLWVVVVVPATLTVLINLAIGASPARLARQSALRLLDEVAAALRDGASGDLRRHQADVVALVELRARAGLLDHGLGRHAAGDSALIETLAELLILLESVPSDLPSAARAPLAAACAACRASFERGVAPPPLAIEPPDDLLATLEPEDRPVVAALAAALARLAAGLARRQAGGEAPAPKTVKAMFVADAFSNPAHARYALKVTAAVMAAYAIYSGLDWPGISTAITTCFFVALGTLGESVHKFTLRLSGALLGGIAGGLCIVYLLPEMQDIGQLSLLIGAVAFACGWVATSSELLSYAGMQMAFAFFLGVLQGYGPPTDLTGLRDRVVGILLGNFLITLVFSVLWPVSADDAARRSRATALRALGRLLTDDGRGQRGTRLAVVRALGEARRLAAIATFELRLLPSRRWLQGAGLTRVASLEPLAAALFVVAEQPAATLDDTLRAQDAVVASWLAASADQLTASGRLAPVPDLPMDPSVGDPDDPSLWHEVAADARRQLSLEIAALAAAGA